MPAPPVIADLVERFDQQSDAYKYLRRQIDASDTKIGKLVYELYGLSEDEINIVEEAAK